MAKVWSKLLQTRQAVGSVIFHTAITFVGRSIVDSLVDVSAQIASTEVMAEIIIAIAAISIAIWISPTTMVIAAIVAVVPAAVVILATIMATVSTLTVSDGSLLREPRWLSGYEQLGCWRLWLDSTETDGA